MRAYLTAQNIKRGWYLLIIPVKILELFDRFLSVARVCKEKERVIMNTWDTNGIQSSENVHTRLRA